VKDKNKGHLVESLRAHPARGASEITPLEPLDKYNVQRQSRKTKDERKKMKDKKDKTKTQKTRKDKVQDKTRKDNEAPGVGQRRVLPPPGFSPCVASLPCC
jgi:hypothetical protein